MSARGIVLSSGTRDRLLMRISVRPSLRYSRSGLPVLFANGSTAIPFRRGLAMLVPELERELGVARNGPDDELAGRPGSSRPSSISRLRRLSSLQTAAAL